MVIVGGSFELDEGDHDAFVVSRLEMMRTSRAEAGCIEYTFSADPLDARRVVLFERWETQAALDAHLTSLRAQPTAPRPGDVQPISSTITIYDVSGEHQLGR